jgi:uncharacterized protein (TIGR00290 family)
LPARVLRRVFIVNEKILLSWSGGKDSALALDSLRQSGEYEIAALLSTVTEGYQRTSMHGVRRELVRAQADALDCTLEEVLIPKDCSDEEYGRRMEAALRPHVLAGMQKVAFGDLFLEDVRQYRVERLALIGMTPVFPIWGANTAKLARSFVERGFRAVVVCVDTRAMDPSFAGREFDSALLANLPPGVDPCGENGEFHTFVYDGPIFEHPVQIRRGERVIREERFEYCDILLAVAGVS